MTIRDGYSVCVGVRTNDGRYTDDYTAEDWELSHVAQYLALKYDETNFIGKGYA